MNELKQIPYGISNFAYLRRSNFYYVDKTMHIPTLERIGNFLFLVRPRRMGKSLMLSMLSSYYDINQAKDFDTLFDNLWIHEHPTTEKNRFLVLYLDFSQISAKLENLEEKVEEFLDGAISRFVRKYEDRFYAGFFDEIAKFSNGSQKLVYVTGTAKDLGLPLYLIIDEYDNFTNNILNAIGFKEYQDITHGVGFYRDLFKKFKPNFERILMLGVSPITLDDLTSGFNISTNYTTRPKFNAMLGLDEEELRQMIEYYRQAGAITSAADDIICDMKPWYDNYCFAAENIDKPKVFNTSMAMRYLSNLVEDGRPPKELLDPNVRTDYSKLRRLIEIDGAKPERKRIIQQITTDGYIRKPLVSSFPAEHIGDENNYVSLLFYYGMLTISGEIGEDLVLSIPNRCINEMYYSYMRDIYDSDGIISMDSFRNSFRAMAEEGDPTEFATYIAKLYKESTSVRMLIDGERAVQTFLLAYIKLTTYYITKAEREMNHGYADIVLLPNPDPKFSNVRHAYVIELKYITKGDDSETMRQTKLAEAQEQLSRYAQDTELLALPSSIQIHTMAMIFAGEELAIVKHEVVRR